MVLVEVEVSDAGGVPVSELKRSDFLVYEEGKRQKIMYFSEERAEETENSRITYVIGYQPTVRPIVGEFRTIRMRVRKSKELGLKVFYRPDGYVANH
jgi:hypothetical protein